MKIDREQLLSFVTSKITRDNGKRFTNTDRLDFIRNTMLVSEYEIMGTTPLSVIYKKKGVALPEKIVLLSTHVDCVSEITEPYFEIKKNTYKGTFDNAATNAAVLISMLENLYDDNVVVAFTGDEERNQNGAKQVIKFLAEQNKKVVAISLDVTFKLSSEIDEKYKTYKNASYTIDNLCSNTTENIARELFKLANESANESGIRFMVTRAGGASDYFEHREYNIRDYYDSILEVEDVAYEDEALSYSTYRNCIGAFSICLPTNDNDDEWKMHSNKPIKIKKKAFDEYITAVANIGNGLAAMEGK